MRGPAFVCCLLTLTIMLSSGFACHAANGAKKEEDTPAFVTDRPDVSEGSTVVPRGFTQIELGLRHSQATGGAKGYFIDDLFRIGIKEKWELRLGGAGPSLLRSAGSSKGGIAPFYVGLKKHFTEARNGRPSIGWLFNANIPSPSRAFTTGHLDGNFLICANQEIGKLEIEFNAGPGVAYDLGQSRYFPQVVYALTPSYFARKSFRAYAELFGAAPGEKAGRAAASGGAGLQWYDFNRLTAFDVSFTTGVSSLARGSNRISFSLGYSMLR